MKIASDPAAAAAAMDTIGQRHEALMGHVWMAIRNGIDAHNKLEQSHGFARATPAEFDLALVHSPELFLLDIAAVVGDGDVAPAATAAADVGDHSGFDHSHDPGALAIIKVSTNEPARNLGEVPAT